MTYNRRSAGDWRIGIMKKMAWTIGILVVLQIFMVYFFGFGLFTIGELVVQKMFFGGGKIPDDGLSRVVYDEVGKDLTYWGKKELKEYDGWYYEYELKKMDEDAGTISNFVKAVNSAMGNNQEKIEVVVFVDDPLQPGAFAVGFYLSNYYDYNLEKEDYDGLWLLHIHDRPDIFGSVAEPAAYTGIEGIRQLEIGVQMQQRADEEGIDWYECWPDLEEIIFSDDISHAVYDEVGSDYFYFLGNDYNNSVYWYNYLLKQTDAETISKFAKVINSTQGNKEEQIDVSVYADLPDLPDITGRSGIPDSRAKIFRLRRYFSSSGEKAGYDESGELFIYDPDTGDEQFFPDPAVYTGIEGIKRLQIGKQMQQRADKEGIDWYECWPDLEEVTVIGADSENTR